MRLDQEVDWEKISTESGVLPPQEYVCIVKAVEDDITQTNNLPRTTIKLEIQEPAAYAGREISDRLTMKTKKGEVNKISMGRIKAFAQATVGEDRLKSPDFDTKEFEAQTVRVVTGLRAYQEDEDDPQVVARAQAEGKPIPQRTKQATEIMKVLKA